MVSRSRGPTAVEDVGRTQPQAAAVLQVAAGTADDR
ncbi:hypothetical protein PSMK_11430 [Phycisphaera mikurensis NBRC 102666]|uniref:Uncharacterized protein n=1 Tax=Phycisphaera mikurensis (strain NBRC 102666 / KCTC 22515 / FYK2301M01) TaxID=1142394 RepID=I0IDG4_PHYMF|nr:hypothetical protein PSMK_11430 [Phycisphaera mikurensis NBRC 102666]